MNIEDLAPTSELSTAAARSVSGGMSQPAEHDGLVCGPADQPNPTTEDWYPSFPALPAWPTMDYWSGEAPTKWW